MKEAKEILALIEESDSIVLTSHKSPDGDSVGSTMAMFYFIKSLGKTANICHPDPAPSSLNWVKGDANFIDFVNHPKEVSQIIENADLLFAMDYNGANRMGSDMGNLFDAALGKKVMIDHHPYPDDFVDIAASYPSVCSTCELVYELAISSNKESLIDRKMGTAIYLGIMTDTGSFRFSSVTSRTHEVIANLLKIGVEHTIIHENTFDDTPLNRLKLRGYAIANKIEVLEKEGVAVLWLSEEELERFNYKKGDTEGLVNIALSIVGVNVAAFFSEKDDQVKISFRSKGSIAVNNIAMEHFNGGGHMNAAGGVANEPIQDAVERFKLLVPKYFG